MDWPAAWKALYRLARRRGASHDDAEDIAQTVCERMLRRGIEPVHLRAYLAIAANNEYRTRRMRAGRMLSLDLPRGPYGGSLGDTLSCEEPGFEDARDPRLDAYSPEALALLEAYVDLGAPELARRMGISHVSARVLAVRLRRQDHVNAARYLRLLEGAAA